MILIEFILIFYVRQCEVSDSKEKKNFFGRYYCYVYHNIFDSMDSKFYGVCFWLTLFIFS